MQNDIRIFFTKTGMAKYISHLDLMRCMSRAFKRAQISLWFTEGFNPHLFMTFARPLSLGQESLCEVVDVRLVGEMTLKEIKTRMNNVLPRDITVVSVQKPEHKPSEIAAADYEIRLFCAAPEVLCAHLESAFAAPQITVRKKAKQGRKKIEKEIDIKPNVLSFDVAAKETHVLLNIRLTAGDQNNINPTLLLNALTADFPSEIDNTQILKTKILLENGEQFC